MSSKSIVSIVTLMWVLALALLILGIVLSGCRSEPPKAVVQKTIVQSVIVRPIIVRPNVRWQRGPYGWYYQYQYQYLPPLPDWQRQWWYDAGQNCWWQYDIGPRPRPFFERRTMIPRDTKGGIDRYVDYGVPTGGFLRAVLSNDLFTAVKKADYHNKLALEATIDYINSFTPVTCFGSPEEVEAWLKFHREKPEEANRTAGGDREQRERYYDQESRK